MRSGDYQLESYDDDETKFSRSLNERRSIAELDVI